MPSKKYSSKWSILWLSNERVCVHNSLKSICIAFVSSGFHFLVKTRGNGKNETSKPWCEMLRATILSTFSVSFALFFRNYSDAACECVRYSLQFYVFVNFNTFAASNSAPLVFGLLLYILFCLNAYFSDVYLARSWKFCRKQVAVCRMHHAIVWNYDEILHHSLFLLRLRFAVPFFVCKQNEMPKRI